MEDKNMKRVCDCPMNGRCLCVECEKNENCFGGFKRYSIIKASAGTGKTYQLAMRYVQLLILGAKPESILALTFTRKAAGEIYRRIIGRLYEMIGNHNSCGTIDPRRLVQILRGLLNCSKNLQISTIDSFFAKMLLSFAPELGIWGQGSIIDYGDNRYRRDVVHRWILQIAERKDETEELRELLKHAKNNSDEVLVESKLLGLMDSVYYFYLQYENAEGNGINWGYSLDLPPDPYGDDLNEYRADVGLLLSASEDSVKLTNATCRKRLNAFAEFAMKMEKEYTGIVPKEVRSLIRDNLIKNNGDCWCLEDGILNYTGKVELPEDVSDTLRKVFLHMAWIAYIQGLKRTAAIHRLSRDFDRAYAAQIRNNGLLTFADLPFLLAGERDNDGGIFASEAADAYEYRLDSQVRHYLFDEFQDTSDSQWEIFDRLTSNQLLSGIPDDFRSFFCVGDIKQSIYGWRGGDPKLFGYLEHKLDGFCSELGYNASGTLTKSYRSSSSVLELVNRVFEKGIGENPDALQDLEFEEHSAGRNIEGFSALLHIEKDDKKTLIETNAAVIYRILHIIRPLDRGFSVGILVQSNAAASEYLAELKNLARMHGDSMQFSAHGQIALTDIAAYTVLKELIVLAGHPGDTRAREYLKMITYAENEESATAECIGEDGLLRKLGFCEEIGDLSSAVRHDIAQNGLSRFIDRFSNAFKGELSAREAKKLKEVREYSEGFSGTPDEFIDFVECVRGDEKSLENTVQIMTIHQSKGLEFDVVFTPDLGNTNGNHGDAWAPSVEISQVEYGDGTRFKRPQWISFFPDELFIMHSDVFARYRNQRERQEDFAKLCKIYVALTRAKRGLFVLVFPPKEPSVFAPDKWIEEKLGAAANNEKMNMQGRFFDELEGLVYAKGNPMWFEQNPICSVVQTAEQSAADPEKRTAVRMGISRRHERLASQEHQLQVRVPAEKRFSIRSTTETGTIVHELCEKIEFITEDWDETAFVAAHCREDNDSMRLAADIVLHAFRSGSIVRAALERPEGNVELWREKRFLLQNDAGEIIPGAFDRVVIRRNAEGHAVDAVIYDYKSDALQKPDEFLERHEGQLLLYRKALSRMLSLDEERIACRILALRPGFVVNV